MNAGYVPALGTPLDGNGDLNVISFQREIEDQIASGAVGVLVMGSMGIQSCIRNNVFPEVVKVAVETVNGRIPVFVGAMDNSLARIRDRIQSVNEWDVDGYVLTTPYYGALPVSHIISFYKSAASLTDRKILIYDLPSVTQAKITFQIVKQLVSETSNLGGIKSADMQMFRKLKLDQEIPADFIMVYSGLDTMDISFKWGIDHCLDGMFTCTPYNASRLFQALRQNQRQEAAKYLNNILSIRDLFIKYDLWPSYTAAMNVLGYEGIFHPDYIPNVDCDTYKIIKENLQKVGER